MTSHDSSPLLNIAAFISQTLTMPTAEELLEFFNVYMKAIGFEHVAFFLMSDNNQMTRKVEDGLFYHTFPKEWTDHYRDNSLLEHDPMVELSKSVPRPFRWMVGEEQSHLNDLQKRVINDMRDFGFSDGIAAPIFLPGGRIIHCAVATRNGKVAMSDSEMIEIGYLCHQVYNRYNELNRSETIGVVINLSKRESDVLHWAAAGKSNTSIADILGISPHTVDTMMRRCFKKLNVSNRTSAVLKAVSIGLISP